jgi:hypothetical protein
MLMAARTLGAAVVLLAASVAVAAPRARDHYERGLQLYQADQFQEAANEFMAAYALRPKPIILFNIAQALRKAGRFSEALDYYRRFLVAGEPGELEAETNSYVNEIEAHLALEKRLREKAAAPPPVAAAPPPPVAAAPPPPVAAAPPPVAAPPPHVAAAAPPPVATPPPPRPIYQRWWLWTAVGAVVAAVAVGVGVGVGTRSSDPSTALGTRTPSF